MRMEIERKFLIKDESWRAEAGDGMACRQGYLVRDPQQTVRVRIMDGEGFLTIKGASEGLGRAEFEYNIPVSDAEELLQRCGALIEKMRYIIPFAGMTWELDVFAGENRGLVLAEIELESEDQPFDRPAWAGEEVTADPRYYNAYLAQHPFTAW